MTNYCFKPKDYISKEVKYLTRITFSALAIIVLTTACIKKIGPEIGPKSSYISFDSPVLSPNTKANQTKAPISGTTLPKDIDFKVFAVKHTEDYSNWSSHSEFTIGDVSYNDDAKGWTTATPTLWPSENQKLSFIAYAPADISATFPEADPLSSGIKFSNYTISQNYLEQQDLLYSERVVNQVGNSGVYGQEYHGVQIPFHHALAQVAFTARMSEEYYRDPDRPLYFCYVKLKGIVCRGDFDQGLSPSDGGGVVGNPTWTLSTNEDDRKDYIEQFPREAELTPYLQEDACDPCLVIPQQFTDDMGLEISYVTTTWEIDTYRPDLPPQSVFVKFKDLLYDGVSISGFEPGKRYVFNLVIGGRRAMYFSPSVEQWSDVNASQSIDY